MRALGFSCVQVWLFILSGSFHRGSSARPRTSAVFVSLPLLPLRVHQARREGIRLRPYPLAQAYHVHGIHRCGVKPLKASPVVYASVNALSKLLYSCALGVGAQRAGVLDANAIKVLSRLIFSVFQPALLFVNVAKTVSENTHKLSLLLCLPLFATAQIFIGMSIGFLLTKSFFRQASDESKRELTICTSFANSGPLPLLFVDAIFRSHPNPVLLQNAVAYISLYLLGWSPLFWSVGYSILCPSIENAWWKSIWSKLNSPPVLGSIAGLIVGVCGPLRDVLLSPNAPLLPLFEALRTLGSAYLPAALLVLAGSLLGGANTTESLTPTKNHWSNTIPAQLVGIAFARFLIMPATTFAGVSMLAKRWPSLAADKVLMFILLMQACMPSAQNSTIMLQLEGKTRQAMRVARLLLCVYVCSTPAIGLLMSRALSHTNALL